MKTLPGQVARGGHSLLGAGTPRRAFGISSPEGAYFYALTSLSFHVFTNLMG